MPEVGLSQLLITIPHSGERIPPEARWLDGLPEEVLMRDVDRFVDRLYEPSLKALNLPFVKTEWHRYVVDLNRIPTDVNAASVKGHADQTKEHHRGFHWVVTTLNEPLMKEPISQDLHDQLTQLIYEPFHAGIRSKVAQLFKIHKEIFHIDAHSMPSVGTKMHKDPGERRADIVVSDCVGTSCKKEFRDLVIAAYCTAGFKVGYNWPYGGGRVTEQYGHPAQGHHAIQVELNRDLYMNETTKKYKDDAAVKIQIQIQKALTYIQAQLPV